MAPGAEPPQPHVELRAWASGHGAVNQAGRDLVIVYGGVTRHLHEHFHAGAEADERTLTPSSVDTCPYPGLRPFDVDDAGWFFGRETLVSRLIGDLELSLADRRPLAVVAPSGAGKSSLLRAGLLDALRRGQLPGSRSWPHLLLTPTDDPLAALTSGFSRLTGAGESRLRAALDAGPGPLRELLRERLALPAGGRLVLVVDQLEELFTLGRSEDARRRFIDAIAGLTGGDDPVAVAVYGLRADAYGSCAAFPHLREALTHRQVIVGPMSEDEVRRAMTRPAERAGLVPAPGLVDVILRDLRGAAPRDDGAYETGRLPLLAHALRATWQQRRDDTLTVGSYRDTGGIGGAVQATAEAEFARLDPGARQTARQLFLGLVRIGENGEGSRRRRTRTDLLLATSAPGSVPAIVDRFTGARLFTQGVLRGEGTVEVTHEALLWAWPRLRGWIAEAGSGALIRQELEDTALGWERGGRRDAGVLLRGARLEAAQSWARQAGPEHISPVVLAFLGVSRRQARRNRRLRNGAVSVTTVLALIATGLAVFAFDQRGESLRQRDEAIFNRVSAEADRRRDGDPALAAQLDLVADTMRSTPQTRTRLMETAGAVLPASVPEQNGIVHSVAFGADGNLATGSDAVRLWDTARPTDLSELASVEGSGRGARVSASYDAGGELLAVGSGDGRLRILDASDAGHPVPLSGWVPVADGPVANPRFSPDGRTLAFASTTHTDGTTTAVVQLWDVSDPGRPRPLSTALSSPGQSVASVAFNPTGTVLAVGGGTAPGSDQAHLLRLWDVTDPSEPVGLGGDLGGHSAVVNQVAFSPLTDLLASAGSDNRVLLWDVSQPREPQLVQQLFLNSVASSVAFSPDARLLATGENAGSVYLWNVGAPASARVIGPPLRGHTTTVTGLAFAPGGRMLASGSGDGAALVWRLPPSLAVAESGAAVAALAVSGDGELLAVASGSLVSLWDVSDPARLARVGALPLLPSAVNALAFREADGAPALLATGGDAGEVRLWDVSDPGRPRARARPAQVTYEAVHGLVFDASGHTLVATTMMLQGGYRGGVYAWDVSDPDRPGVLDIDPSDQHARPVNGLAAAPDGGHVYTGEYYAPGSLGVWRTGRGEVPSPAGRTNTGQIVMSVAADPRGGVVATGTGESEVWLWDVSRPSSPGSPSGPLNAGGMAFSVGFSPDGGLLAAGNGVGQIRLWDTSDPSRPVPWGLPVDGHGSDVVALRFGPVEGALFTGGRDGTVRVWQTDPAGARAVLCSVTGSAMTPERWDTYVSPDLPYDPPCAT
ncbi:hypothetical protein [Streptomyces xiamenensis]|uniref:nSTAND1 domain-containing NTPase n=1 Tax=Streptomyces xiamenensis TaxID=408015 RepID=UPI003D72198E